MSSLSSTDQTSPLLEQASHSVDHAIRATQQAANGAVDEVAGSLQDLRHKTVPMLERASAMAYRGMDKAQQLRIKAEQASDTAVNYIQHKPIKTVLIAAAAGAALMALMSLAVRTRDHG